MSDVDAKAIHRRLTETYGAVAGKALMKRQLGEEKIIVLSDQHKGARDGADDFQRCERAYNAALAYYDHLEYHLILLGDVEELWENEIEEVIGSYPTTLALEAKFNAAGRYTRVWGNHDLVWNKAERFDSAMRGFGLGGVEPVEAVRLTIVNGGENGEDREIFLVHGHQGTKDSERNAWLSQFAVRRGWRRLQNMINKPWNSPSVDWNLRGQHSEAMKAWAEQRGQVMIAGHTHLPVFWNNANQPEADPGEVETPAGVEDPKEAEALRLARVEWAKAEHERLKHQKPIPMETPCYFNTGCCSFGDGDITGIEISGGHIRLVRWPARPDTSREELVPALPLTEVFKLVRPAA